MYTWKSDQICTKCENILRNVIVGALVKGKVAAILGLVTLERSRIAKPNCEKHAYTSGPPTTMKEGKSPLPSFVIQT